MSEIIEKELDWDAEISRESDFVLLPEGDYDFKVTGFERARHEGSAKLPPCNKAVITLEIESAEGKVYIKHNLFLHTKCEGLISAFFIGIGQKKHGEPLKMNWNNVIGATGRCRITVREWINNNGEKMQSNEVKKFYEPKTSVSQTATNSTVANSAGGVFTPGKF